MELVNQFAEFARAHHGALILFLVGQFGFDFGDISGQLSALFDDLLVYLLAVVTFIWNVLVAAVNYLLAAVQFIWNFITTIVKDLQSAFKWIWENVIKGGLTKLVSLFNRARAWLKQTFGPVIDYLKKLRAYYQWYFNHYIRPILQLLGIARRILTIFRLLGFKWAARLDADIANIENKIAQVYTKIIGYLNQTITWLDLIVDPTGILRRNPLFGALITDSGALRNLVLGAGIRPLSGDETASQAADRAIATPATAKSNFQNYYSQRTVPPEQQDSITQFKAAFADLQQGQGDYE